VERLSLEGLSQEWKDLLDAARQARENSYSPYSKFSVGAAVRASSGRIYTGCNIENAAYGLTVCAERVAIWKAVSEGEREFTGLAVVTDSRSTPCGSCRQVMREFVDDLPVLIGDLSDEAFLTRLGELLPHAFSMGDLKS